MATRIAEHNRIAMTPTAPADAIEIPFWYGTFGNAPGNTSRVVRDAF
jgi:hypothetical protein